MFVLPFMVNKDVYNTVYAVQHPKLIVTIQI